MPTPPTVKRHMFAKGGEIIRSTKDGPQRIHVYLVTGLTCNADTDDPLYEALSQPQIPIYGTPHEKIPGVYCVDVYGEHFNDDKTAAKITATFGRSDASLITSAQISFSGTTREKLKRIDVDGKQIIVTYNGDTATTISDFQGIQMPCDSPVLEPHGILEYEWEGNTPIDIKIIGKLNKNTWNDGKQGQWVCRNAIWREVQNRGTFQNFAQFEYDEDYWNKAVLWRDALTGALPSNVNNGDKIPLEDKEGSGNGWVRAKNYHYFDFGQLGLRQVY